MQLRGAAPDGTTPAEIKAPPIPEKKDGQQAADEQKAADEKAVEKKPTEKKAVEKKG